MTIQRRWAYRVDLSIPFSFSVIDAAEAELVGEERLSKTQNISVAGLRFETSLRLEEGDKLEIELPLPASQSVNPVGLVVRSEPVEQPGNNLNSVAVRFLQLEEQDQIRLVDFLAQRKKNEGSAKI
jgi:c-di-GMP-binding flagellar brake protein YcgR